MTELVINENAAKVVDRLIDFNCEPTTDSIINSLNNKSESLILLNNDVFTSIALPKIIDISPDHKRKALVEIIEQAIPLLSLNAQIKLKNILKCVSLKNSSKQSSSGEIECKNESLSQD
jgi:hypothetical protein